MEEFCHYCIIAPYNSLCTCKATNDICPFVWRCAKESRWKPLGNMQNCKAGKEKDNMYKHKIRFEKRGILFVENDNFVVEIKNPFGDNIPDGVNDLIKVDGVWYIRGYEPQPKTQAKPKITKVEKAEVELD